MTPTDAKPRFRDVYGEGVNLPFNAVAYDITSGGENLPETPAELLRLCVAKMREFSDALPISNGQHLARVWFANALRTHPLNLRPGFGGQSQRRGEYVAVRGRHETRISVFHSGRCIASSLDSEDVPAFMAAHLLGRAQICRVIGNYAFWVDETAAFGAAPYGDPAPRCAYASPEAIGKLKGLIR